MPRVQRNARKPAGPRMMQPESDAGDERMFSRFSHDDDDDDDDDTQFDVPCARPDVTRIEDPTVTQPRTFADDCVFTCAQTAGWLCRLACIPVIAYTNRHAPAFGYSLPSSRQVRRRAIATPRSPYSTPSSRTYPKVPSAPSARYLHSGSGSEFKSVPIGERRDDDDDGVSSSEESEHSESLARSSARDEMYATVAREGQDEQHSDTDDDGVMYEISGVRIMRPRHDRSDDAEQMTRHDRDRAHTSEEQESISPSDDDEGDDDLQGFESEDELRKFQRRTHKELLSISISVEHKYLENQKRFQALSRRPQQRRRRRANAAYENRSLLSSDSEYDTQTDTGLTAVERAEKTMVWWKCLHEEVKQVVSSTSADTSIITHSVAQFIDECKAYLRENNAVDQYKREGNGVCELPEPPRCII